MNADIGQIITDAEAHAFIDGFAQADEIVQTLLIRGVEAKIIRRTGQKLVNTTITDEEISIAPETVRDGIVINPRTEWRVRYSPILTWTSLKAVTARNESSGAVSASDVLQRNSYHVDLPSGIVRLLNQPGVQPFEIYPSQSFPTGIKNLLASYTTGLLSVGAPYDLKLLALKIVARLFLQQKNNRWDSSTMSFGDTSVTFLNVEFTKGEEGDVDMFRRPFLV